MKIVVRGKIFVPLFTLLASRRVTFQLYPILGIFVSFHNVTEAGKIIKIAYFSHFDPMCDYLSKYFSGSAPEAYTASK